MKKDLIFAPVLLLVGFLLFMFRATGVTAHIILSVIGALVLIFYTVLTKAEWNIPSLEIIIRAFYGVALISGTVVLNVNGIEALTVIHKASALLFLALIVVLLAYKAALNKRTILK